MLRSVYAVPLVGIVPMGGYPDLRNEVRPVRQVDLVVQFHFDHEYNVR